MYSLHKSFSKKEIEVFTAYFEWAKYDDLTQWLDSDELEHFNETVYHLNAEIDDFLQKNDPMSYVPPQPC